MRARLEAAYASYSETRDGGGGNIEHGEWIVDEGRCERRKTEDGEERSEERI